MPWNTKLSPWLAFFVFLLQNLHFFLLFQFSAFLLYLFDFLTFFKKALPRAVLNTLEHRAVAYHLWRAQIPSAEMHFPTGFGCPCPLHTGSRTAFETPVSSTWLYFGLFVALLMISWEKKTQTKKKALAMQRAWMPGQDFYFWALPAKTLTASVTMRQQTMSLLLVL